jgi:2-(1,2-epoxy-1,2-dihydrophenyl)acetyl-CoA isomerase
MKPAPLLIERDGPVGIIMLNRPSVGNALDVMLVDALLAAVLEVDADPNMRAVVLTGVGNVFCAGGDVAAFGAAGAAAPALIKRLTAPLHAAIARLLRMEKPLVVAVNGAAAGAGFGLSLIGDVVLASRKARFSAAYDKIGLSPDAGLTWLLPRLVGLRQAQRLVLTGARVSAEEAFCLGLVSEIVEEDVDLLGVARDLARTLALSGLEAWRRSRELLLSSHETALETQLEREAQAIAACAGGREGQEGIASFLERREPDFATVRRP